MNVICCWREGETSQKGTQYSSGARQHHAVLNCNLAYSLYLLWRVLDTWRRKHKAETGCMAISKLPFLGTSGISLPLIIRRCSFTGNSNRTQVQSCCWPFNHSVIWVKSEPSYTTKHWQVACTSTPAASAPAELRNWEGAPRESIPSSF